MQKISGARGTWFICVGILLAILGVGLMGFRVGHLLFLFLLVLGILFLHASASRPPLIFGRSPFCSGKAFTFVASTSTVAPSKPMNAPLIRMAYNFG
jgi:hypothetical protein